MYSVCEGVYVYGVRTSVYSVCEGVYVYGVCTSVYSGFRVWFRVWSLV